MSSSILIVEDDATIQRALKDYFINKGYEVRTARDGEEGLDAALNSRFDLPSEYASSGILSVTICRMVGGRPRTCVERPTSRLSKRVT